MLRDRETYRLDHDHPVYHWTHDPSLRVNQLVFGSTSPGRQVNIIPGSFSTCLDRESRRGRAPHLLTVHLKANTTIMVMVANDIAEMFSDKRPPGFAYRYVRYLRSVGRIGAIDVLRVHQPSETAIIDPNAIY